MSEESVPGFAIAAVREDGNWRCAALDESALRGLDEVADALRKLRSTGAVVGLLGVDDQFFMVVRPSPAGVSLLVSDAAAALDYDIAADALDLLRVDPPEDDEEIVPEGALDILADIGLPAAELQVIIDEVDLYPDEQLRMIAQRCGFDGEFDRVLDSLDSITT